MKRKSVFFLGAACFALLVGTGVVLLTGGQVVRAQAGAPAYRVAPLWPLPFPDDSWVIGSVSGVTVDSQNHVWVVHRGNDSLEGNEKGMLPTAGRGGVSGPPSSSVCCIAAPVILEYDAAGKYLSGFGGPSSTYVWPQTTGGIAVDGKGNVWIAGAGADTPPPAAGRGRGAAPAAGATAPPAGTTAPPAGATAPPAGRGDQGRGGALPPPPPPPPGDSHVLKFSRNGLHMLTIGTPGKMDGADSQSTLNRPAAIAYDSAANEVFVADSGNHRIVVFDADKGTYKRHWFAYGEKAAGAAAGPYDPNAPAAKSFRDVSCVEIAKDGMVYVCDKSSNRIQVFDKSGKFVKEGVIAKNTMGGIVTGSFGAPLNAAGSVWDIAFSSDPQQRFIFVADGQNKKVRIVNRDTLAEVGAFGGGGRYPGQFLAVAAIATDAQGNVYTGELHHGKRVQKFTPGK
jgi:DNA-binding beta-propeller fold protein YncE